jgi:GNAT superfamily N-acetyltransferase
VPTTSTQTTPPSAVQQQSRPRPLRLRPLRADDAPRLIALYQRLSPETIRKRFLRYPGCTDPRQAVELATVDQINRVAFAVVTDSGEDEAIVAVGRFHRDGDDHAELALLVEDGYQHRGLGRFLLEELIDTARRLRLQVLDGFVLYNNTSMLRLLRTSGRRLEVGWNGGDVLDFKLLVNVAA